METETRTAGSHEIMGTNHPVIHILRKNGRTWTVTRNVCNGVSDYGTSTEFKTLRAAREALNA